MNNQIVIIIKVVLAFLFFICLLNMPYGFYELVRFLALIGFLILAYYHYINERKFEFFLYVSLAILFQPIFKISLGRELWNITDIVIGLWLLLSIFIDLKKNKLNL